MKDVRNRIIIAHGHIFKNAGTTFDWSLKRNFGKSFIDHSDSQDMKQGGPDYLSKFIDDNAKLEAFASHHLYWCMPFPKRPSVKIIPCYLLRHPIERARSVYAFERRQKSNTPGAIHAKKLNFRDYIEWRMEHKGGGVVMNYQLKYCSGRKGFEVNNDLVRETAEHISSASLAGIVDRYDESMVFFEEHLRCDFPQIDLSYIRQNVSREGLAAKGSLATREGQIQAVLSELGSVAGVLEENNRADFSLYELVNKGLDTHISKIDEFSEKLQNFRLRCSQLNGNY
jgi:hypothetical protein